MVSKQLLPTQCVTNASTNTSGFFTRVFTELAFYLAEHSVALALSVALPLPLAHFGAATLPITPSKLMAQVCAELRISRICI